jgi:SAM-dependent methyltransferase
MIPSRNVFEDHAGEYDLWFDEHVTAYWAEVRVLRDAVPFTGRGLEVGTGSGRFAAPLGIRCGIDPSPALGRIALQRGVEVVLGEGEHLPYRAGTFDYALMMTVICFVDEPVRVFQEIFRVLRSGGLLVAGFIEASEENSLPNHGEFSQGLFLRYAKLRASGEVTGYFRDAGFTGISTVSRVCGICVMIGRKESSAE